MRLPKRAREQEGSHAVVDGIHFPMPIETRDSQAFLAAYTIDADRAQALLPGQELHAVRLWGNRGLLLIAVINYEYTDIGKYIEFSVGVACTRGRKRAPRLLPMLFRNRMHFGQYVVELPVSTEVSVKGGKGIWGMPKHQAPLDFLDDAKRVSSQYDLDGQLVMRVDVQKGKIPAPSLPMSAVNFSFFRGMLIKSAVTFMGRPRLGLLRPRAEVELGDHPRAAPLKTLDMGKRPLMTAYYGDFGGVLDDHLEAWFMTWPEVPTQHSEGLESVVPLGYSQDWPPPPRRTRP